MCLADWTKLPSGGGARFGAVEAAACRAVSVAPSTAAGGRASCRRDYFACQCCEAVPLDGRRGWAVAMAANGALQAVTGGQPTFEMRVHEHASTCLPELDGEDWGRSWHERLSPGDLPVARRGWMQPMSLSQSLQRARSWMHVQRPCVRCAASWASEQACGVVVRRVVGGGGVEWECVVGGQFTVVVIASPSSPLLAPAPLPRPLHLRLRLHHHYHHHHHHHHHHRLRPQRQPRSGGSSSPP